MGQILEHPTLTGNLKTKCDMLRAHGVDFSTARDRHGRMRIHAVDWYVTQGRSKFLLRDVTDWSLHRLGGWLGY